jgi:vancomycin resistance protein YoaR
MTFVSVPPPRRSPVPFQVVAALGGGLLLFFLAICLVTGGWRLLYKERIFPGITMAGLDLTNMTKEEADAALNQRLAYPTSGQIVFRYGDQAWTTTPAELGIFFDAGTSFQSAYSIGRQGGLITSLAGQLNAWQGGLDLKPVMVFDERVAWEYIRQLAAQIDQPVIETNLQVKGTDVLYTQGQTGRRLNVDDALSNLISKIKALQDGEIQLVVEEETPVVKDASAQADALRRALSAPLTLSVPDAKSGDPGPWVIEPSLVAGMLTIGRVQTDNGWQYQVSVDTQALDQLLGQIASQVDRIPQNAHFYFDDASHQLVLVQSSTTGRTLDVDASRDSIGQKLLQGEHNIPLMITQAQPQVGDDATAASLGITGLVPNGVYTSYFRGSGAARLQNIQAAASRFYGLLIPPNTTFSMSNAIGDISLDNGYAEALIIYNGQTITGVGGGVCQVSTTLFRTALYSGYPIVERHEHAYRVYYYEQTAAGTDPNLAGLDATVYFPLVDLKFTNDRPYWLLMETYFNADDYSLTWKFYSGDDGRTVDVQNLGLRNITPAPDPLFEENDDLPAGVCKQVDYAGEGADITVTRAVNSASGETLFNNTFQTKYEPWQAVYQYGPGTEDPQAMAAQGLCH